MKTKFIVFMCFEQAHQTKRCGEYDTKAEAIAVAKVNQRPHRLMQVWANDQQPALVAEF